MQEVTGSSPVSPTNHPLHAQFDRITVSRRLEPVDYVQSEGSGFCRDSWLGPFDRTTASPLVHSRPWGARPHRYEGTYRVS